MARHALHVVCGFCGFLFASLCAAAAGQSSPELHWVVQFAGNGGSERGAGAAPDGSGGMYISGEASRDIGGGPTMGLDAFVARYDHRGQRIWIRQFGGSGLDAGGPCAADGAGGVYVAGTTDGSFAAPSAGRSDLFLARYNEGGNQLWAVQLGSAASDWPTGIASDRQGGVYVCGTTEGSIGLLNLGGRDALLIRYDGTGNALWIRQLGAAPAWGFSYDDEAFGICSDGAGGAYMAGSSSGSLAPGSESGAFLARYSGDGDLLWVRQFGPNAVASARCVAPAPEGGAYIGGYHFGSLGGTGEGRVFVARYSAEGERLWLDQFELTPFDFPEAIVSDSAGAVYLACRTRDLNNRRHIVMVRYTAAGVRDWTSMLGTAEDDDARGLALHNGTSVFLTGTTRGAFPGHALTWNSDAFVARYDLTCYPNCDGSTTPPVLNIGDFSCFVQRFVAGDSWANCDRSTNPPILNILDFACFMERFAGGCP